MKQLIALIAVLVVLGSVFFMPFATRVHVVHAQPKAAVYKHCVVALDPVSPKAGRHVQSKVHSMKCTTDTNAHFSTPANTFMEVFSRPNYGGNSLAFTGPSPCSSSLTYGSTNLNDASDAVSSYKTSFPDSNDMNCHAVVLFADIDDNNDNPGGQGAEFTSYPQTPNVPSLGSVMDHQASSFMVGDTCHDISSCLAPGA